jgi:hypothetical protein
MSGGRPAVCKNRPIVEEATRAGWSRLRKARRVLAWIRIRGANQVSREDARREGLGLALNAHPSLHVIWLLEGVGFRRKAAYEPDSADRLPLRRDVNPAVIGVSLAETAETPLRLPAVASVSASRPDWRNACGNCGNSFAGSKR